MASSTHLAAERAPLAANDSDGDVEQRAGRGGTSAEQLEVHSYGGAAARGSLLARHPVAVRVALGLGLLGAAAAVVGMTYPGGAHRRGPQGAAGAGSLAALYDASSYGTPGYGRSAYGASAPHGPQYGASAYGASQNSLAGDAAGMPGMPFGQEEPAGVSTTAPAAGSKPKAICQPNEEEWGGLCYKQCAILTHGRFKKRFAPDGCCKEFSLLCMLRSERDMEGIFPGNGYIVGGDGGRPHPPGRCDGNEEEHLGVCYKKCALLTDGDYPRRWMANTCCKADKFCINPFNTKTLGVPGACTGFGVGGGVNGHDCPHKPV